jgi:hypothetical protein
MADTMNGTAKYVVSGTLKSADWQNTTLIPRDRAAPGPNAGAGSTLVPPVPMPRFHPNGTSG